MNGSTLSPSMAASSARVLAGPSAGVRRLMSFLTSGMAWGAVVCGGLTVWILFGLGGFDYYRTPLPVRGYAPSHALLRPSGPIGQTLGVFGAVFMLVPFIYMARKRIPGLKSMGSSRAWLEVHLFCGIVGPLLVTFHTSFKFNGIVSAAYWSMVIVVLSGFVGRYLYVRIPRSIRGTELTRAELDEEADLLREDLAQSGASEAVLECIHGFETRTQPATRGLAWLFDLFAGEISMGRKIRQLDGDLRNAGLGEMDRVALVQLTTRRALLGRRSAHLQRTKQLFDLWHVFHLPLVYLLLVIAAAHIGLAIYMGYVPFRW
jgi:hypothetical protein